MYQSPLIWFLQLPNSENKNQLCSKQELCKIYQWQSSLNLISRQLKLCYIFVQFRMVYYLIEISKFKTVLIKIIALQVLSRHP